MGRVTRKGVALLAVGLLVAVGLAASGCLGGPPPPPPPPPPTGCDQGSITIGTILSYSGPLGSIAKVIRQGMQIAVDDVNAGKCVKGKKLSIDDRGDDKFDGSVAKQIYLEMLGKGYKGVVGSIGSSVTQQIISANEGDSKGLVVISPASTAVQLTLPPSPATPPERFFRTIPNDGIQGPSAADNIANKIGFKKVGLLFQNELYGQGLRDTFTPAIAAKGGTVVKEVPFPAGTVAFTQEVKQVLDAGPEIIFIPAFYKEQAYLVGEIRNQGFTGPIVCSEAFENREIFTVTPSAKLEGTYFMKAAVDENRPGHKAFVENYTKKYSKAPEAFADYAYDAVIAWVEALRNNPKGLDATGDELSAYLHDNTFSSTITRDVNFDGNGDVEGGTYVLYKIGGGNFVPA